MNVRTLLIPLLVIGAVALAYGPATHSEASLVANSVVTPAPTQMSKPRRSVTAPRVSAELSVAVSGTSVRFSLDVSNTGGKHVELAFPDGQTHDFVVLDADGKEVHRWGADRMFTQSVQNKLLDAGNTIRIVEHSTPALPAGAYTAVATLRSTNYPMQRRVAFAMR